VNEILDHLPASALVLDLASGGGSFDARARNFRTIRADFEHKGADVRADAAALPFRDQRFDAVICNHGMEHFENLAGALRELGRVVKRSGAVFVAVPDVTTFTDKLYRWLARGGGHVNGFSSPGPLIEAIERETGLALSGRRLLYTSLSFLNARNRSAPAPGKMIVLAGGREGFLRVLNAALRAADGWLGTRLSVYGWALYFGCAGEPVRETAARNVCVRCGSGHRAAWLTASGRVRGRWPPVYVCPQCGARNFYFRDEQ
jgi:SAM-dependent methyltransferase